MSNFYKINFTMTIVAIALPEAFGCPACIYGVFGQGRRWLHPGNPHLIFPAARTGFPAEDGAGFLVTLALLPGKFHD